MPRSVSATAVRYTIETDSANFQLSHSNGKLLTLHLGVIQPGKKLELTITFKADEAKVQVALIVIKLQDVNGG